MNTKRKWIFVFVATAVTLLAALASGAAVRADDYQCTGSLGAINVDNLVVPENASCTLNGTIVDGNILVKTNAALYAYDVQVKNNIQADKAARVDVYAGSSVGGNLQIFKSGSVDIQSVNIGSNLKFDENDDSVNADSNTVGGNLQVFKNTANMSINGNNIGGNLQCKENVPPPTGAGNIVSGKMEDQCANFGAVPTPAPSSTPQVPTNTPQVSTGTPQGPTNTPQAATSTPVIDSEAPTVQWIAPVLAGERYDILEGDQVLLEVAASDNDSIEQVIFFRWDAVNLQYVTIGTLDRAPYQINIIASTLNPGWNQVLVIALDTAGNRSDYPSIWLYKLFTGEMSRLIYLPMICSPECRR